MISLLRKRRMSHQASRVPVTVYTRQECCCCHKALDLLATYRKKYNLDVTEVDIDRDPELVAAHGLSVPVVEIDGKVRFRGIVNPVLLERLLAARSS